MRPSDTYYWEMETKDGKVVRQYDENGKEQSWKKLVNPDDVVRVSLIPRLSVLPRHDVVIDRSAGEKFIKRFGRGFIKQAEDGLKLREYVNCIMTNRYRFWVFSDGRCLITKNDYEVYV